MSLAFVRGIHQWQVNSPQGPLYMSLFLTDIILIYEYILYIIYKSRTIQAPLHSSGTLSIWKRVTSVLVEAQMNSQESIKGALFWKHQSLGLIFTQRA